MVKSEWKVQSNPINGEIWFIPYRIRDTSQPVHGGYVEFFSVPENQAKFEKWKAERDKQKQAEDRGE